MILIKKTQVLNSYTLASYKLWSLDVLKVCISCILDYHKKDICDNLCWTVGENAVLCKTFDVKVQVQNVPKLWRQRLENMSFSHGSTQILS